MTEKNNSWIEIAAMNYIIVILTESGNILNTSHRNVYKHKSTYEKPATDFHIHVH